ncbi:formate/nitrite transporter family protein [Brachybacterium sp. NBEC-018]|uniref:formate/nitrite transporter family protein n=1 Tax=Brachybacterium sp. NBEC-018 TaxID=2996004 RepID=UPI0021755DAA|nr:formate/nitrite transporter family protein [Brachybacterium sp. NBEC-018]UVY83202.1 formate/nitrite transporter family protein [Brachybacterium sp. NBEC-018]
MTAHGRGRRQDDAEERSRLGDSDEPVEDELVAEFRSTVSEGAERLHRTWRALIITGLFGGIDVALGLMAMLAVLDATGSKLLGGAAFGIGLFALRLAHSELFTEDFLLPINAVLARHGTWAQLLRLWAVTLVTNLAGGWLFTWILVAAFPRFEDVLASTAAGYLEKGPTAETVALALLAGFTITLVTRMGQGSSEGIVTLANALLSGFLVVGLGMLHGALNSVVIFAAMHAGAPIPYTQWLVWMCWVIPLNILGGLAIITLPRLVRTAELLRRERAVHGADGDGHGCLVRTAEE